MGLSQELREKRSEAAERHYKGSMQLDNYLDTVKWEILPHSSFSPCLVLSICYLLWCMQNNLEGRRFHSFKEIQERFNDWVEVREDYFFRNGLHELLKRLETVVVSWWKIRFAMMQFEQRLFAWRIVERRVPMLYQRSYLSMRARNWQGEAPVPICGFVSWCFSNNKIMQC